MKTIFITLLALISFSSMAQDESVNGDLTIGKPNDAGTLKIKRGTAGGEVAGTIGFLGGGSEVHNLSLQSTSGGGYITFRTNNGGVDERMRIANNGNVGIGTISPDELLHVSKGNVKFEFDSQFGNDPMILFENEGTDANVRQSFYRWSGNSNLYWGTRLQREASSGFKIQMASTSALGSHSFIDALTILNNGNIGLGTSSTGTHRLAVEGSIGAREIKVEASGWSDFVFENDYKLRTLEEVEQHIDENGHLPEIPSEAEVTEKGINLGEMDAKLLQKIEELTLYMIEMNKRVGQLEEKNGELKKEISTLKNE